MTQTIDPTSAPVAAETDLVTAVQRVLQASDEPLTLSKIRASLPAPFRSVGLEELAETLRRQAAANVLSQYPRYRSQQDRFWDRPMPVHVAALIRVTLQEQGPLAWSELRRKLPVYAQGQAESVLQDELGKGRVHRYPRTGRGGERYGVQPPDPKDYLRSELTEVFERLEHLGFTREQLRASALELLHDEEWATPATEAREGGETAEAQPGSEHDRPWTPQETRREAGAPAPQPVHPQA